MTTRQLLQVVCLLALFNVVDSTSSTTSRIDNYATHAPEQLDLHKDMLMFHPATTKQDRQPPLSLLRALRGGGIVLEGRHHECYAVRLPGFFARVVTAILVPVVDGIDYAENKGSWYHM